MTSVLNPQCFTPGRVVATSTGFLTVVVILGGSLVADVANPAFRGIDEAWLGLIGSSRSPFWDAINGFLNLADYRVMLTLHALLALALFVRRRPQTAIFAALAGGSVALLTQTLKVVILRERPRDAAVLTDAGSYPSGHAATTTAFLLVLAILLGRAWMWLVAVLGSIAMMVSRTYLAAHWLMDTVGGACLAAAVVPALWLGYQNICRQENTDARLLLTWRARASRRRRAGVRAGSE
jgi:membrane-associated phospholipid phosphatase